MSPVTIVSGNSVAILAKTLANQLELPLLNTRVAKFKDGEIDVELLENVRGADLFIVQSICRPHTDNLMELILIADAALRASAKSITAVIPYFGYARQDRRVRSARVPISARVVADMLSTCGITRVLTMDLHSEQIQGFFSIPVDNVYGTSLLLAHINQQQYEKPVVVSPDIGGVVRARAVAKRLGNAGLAIIDKRRSVTNQSEAMHLIGDVKGRTCLLVDDIIDTAGTLCNAAQSLKEFGAVNVYAYATHPVLSDPAIENIAKSTLDAVVVADTIPLNEKAKECEKIHVFSIATLLANSIHRISRGESVRALFN